MASRRLGLTCAKATFLVGVFLTPFHLRFSTINFAVSDAATLAAAVLIVLGRRPLHSLPRSLLTATYAFLLFALLSAFRAPELRESLTQILQFAFTFFVQLPVVLTLAQSRRVVHASFGLLVAARLVDVAGVALSGRTSGADRALSFYGDSANQFAYPTAYLLPFLVYGLLQILRGRHSRRVKAAAVLGAIPALLFMLWALAASASRSAVLATLIGAVVFLNVRRGFEISRRAVLRLALTVVLVGLSGYALYQSGYLPSALRERVERTLHDNDTLTRDRIDLARAGWRAFLDSPFLGVGLDNFRNTAGRYGLVVHLGAPHNMWIHLLAEVGLFGTAALFIVVAYWVLVLLRAQRDTADPSHRELLSAFLASMAAILTIHMFIPMMLQRQYWLIYGLGLAWALHTTAWRQASSPARLVRPQGEPYAR